MFRAIVSLLLTGSTDQIWITVFQDKLEKYFGFKFDNEFLKEDKQLLKCKENLQNIPIVIYISSSIQIYDGKEKLKHLYVVY